MKVVGHRLSLRRGQRYGHYQPWRDHSQYGQSLRGGRFNAIGGLRTLRGKTCRDRENTKLRNLKLETCSVVNYS